jgi:hypothetical protein
MRWTRSVLDRRDARDALRLAGQSCAPMAMTATPVSYGPRRVIPAHRLAPRGRMPLPPRRRQHPVAAERWCNQHRPPGVITQQAVKTIACGTPDVFGVTVVTTLVCFLLLRTRLRMRMSIRRSARPHVMRDGMFTPKPGRNRAAGSRTCICCLKMESGTREARRAIVLLDVVPAQAGTHNHRIVCSNEERCSRPTNRGPGVWSPPSRGRAGNWVVITGLVPVIHVFNVLRGEARRGWPEQVRP